RRLRCFRLRTTLAFAAKDSVQLSAQEQKQTREIHPRQQNNNRREREISRVVTAVTRNVELKKFRHCNPADGEKDCAGKRLPNGEIILRRQQIQNERQSNERNRGEGQTQRRDPFLKRKLELEIHLRHARERCSEHDGVETNQDHDSKPEEQ